MAEKTILMLLVVPFVLSTLAGGFFISAWFMQGYEEEKAQRLLRPSEIYDQPHDGARKSEVSQVTEKESPHSWSSRRVKEFFGDPHTISSHGMSFQEYQRARHREREERELKTKSKAPPISDALSHRERDEKEREEWEQLQKSQERAKARKGFRKEDEVSGQESLATPNRKAGERGGGVDEELDRSKSREDLDSGDSSNLQGKAFAFSLPYNVIGVIVSIIWLINIIFIAWLAFGRESSDNMKIPNNSEFHPPVLTTRQSLVKPVTTEQKDVSGDNLNVSGTSHAQAPGLPASVIEKAHDYQPLPLSIQTKQPVQYGRQSISLDTRRSVFDSAQGVSSYSGSRRRFRNRSPSFKFASSLYDSTLEKDADGSQNSDRERSELSKSKPIFKSSLGDYTRFRKFALRKGLGLFEDKDNEKSERNLTPKSKSPVQRRTLNQFREAQLHASHSNHNDIEDCLNKCCSKSSSLASQNDSKTKNSPKRPQFAETPRAESPRDSLQRREKSAEENSITITSNESKHLPASLDFKMYDMNDFASIPAQILEILACPRGPACTHSHSKYRLIGEKLFVFLKGDSKDKRKNKDQANENLSYETFSPKAGAATIEITGVSNADEENSCLTAQQRHIGLSPIPQDVSTQMSSKSLCGQHHKKMINHTSMASTSTQCQFSCLAVQAKHTEIKNTVPTNALKERYHETKDNKLLEKPKSNEKHNAEGSKNKHHNTKFNSIKNEVKKPVKNISSERQDTVMAPPPFGYHIRRDYSSSESTLEVVTDFKVEKNEDTEHTPGYSAEKQSQNGEKKPIGEERTTMPGDELITCKDSSLFSKQRNILKKEAAADDGKEQKRREKKLMIIGKVNYFKMGYKGGNKDAEGVRLRTKSHKKLQNESKDGHAVKRERNTHDFLQHQKTPQFVNINCEHPGDTSKSDHKNDNVKETNGSSPFSRDAFLHSYEPHESSSCNLKGYRPTKNPRRRSSNIRRGSKDVNHNASRFEIQNSAIEAHDHYKISKKLKRPCFNYRPVLKKNMSVQKKCSARKYIPVKLNTLPLCLLNVNTNAGSLETGCEPGLEEQKDEKQTSNTSVQSADQYFSTSDTPGQPGDSDVEISQSFSFNEDKVKNIGKHAADATVKTSGDQHCQNLEVWEEQKQNIMQACNDAIKNRMQRKNLEHIVSDECLNTDENQILSQGATQRKEDSPSPVNKNKKKDKTEAIYIKFESMSKKITTSTLVKGGRKTVGDKLKPERKQLSSAGDARKALINPRKPAVEPVRYTKIMRSSDPLPGNTESRLRTKQISETNLDSLMCIDVPRATRVVAQGSDTQSLRPSESENFISSCSRTDTTGLVKPISCSPAKEIPPQESPEFCSLQNEEDTKTDFTESLSEKTSAITVVNLLNSQTCLQKDATVSKDSSESKDATKDIAKETKEIVVEKTTLAITKSPQQPSSPKKHDHSESSPSQKSSTNDGPNKKTKSTCSRSRKQSHSKSPKDKSPDSDSKSPNKGGTARAKSGGSASKTTSKHEAGQLSRKHRTASLTRRSSKGKKSRSQSPEPKKKRRTSKKKEHSEGKKTSERADSKDEKSKKKGDKKKKRAKKTVHLDDGSETESTGSPKNDKRRSSSYSPGGHKIIHCHTHTPSNDMSFATSEHQKVSISKKSMTKKDSASRRASSTDEQIRSLDRDLPDNHKSKEGKTKSHASAENLTSTSDGQFRLRSAESAPTFTGTVYKAPTKVVQVAPCPKGKKSVKDLQQAEMGWNGSLTESNKAAAAKQPQKRNKLKYYIIKAKSKLPDVQVSKLKRPSNPTDKADGDSVCSASEQDVKSDSVSREKSGAGQIKSVQFSESIEDMEAYRNDSGCDSALLQDRPEGDASLPQDKEIITEPGDKDDQVLECKNKTEKAEEKKEPLFIKKEVPQRSHSTPPRRKRQPIWLKKATKKPSDQGTGPDEKDKTKALNKLSPGPGPLPTRHMQHSSDSLLKNARVNMPVSYSLKPHGASPKMSSLSSSDKKRVNYNTMINRIFLTAPMNKSTRKMIAKVGSPVDIKEIIEGTPVDALDLCKTMRSPTGPGLRTARSVPTLGCVQPDSLHGVKKRTSNDFRFLPHKKTKVHKPHESESTRSLCSNETNDGTVKGGSRYAENDLQASPTYSLSTDIDEAMGIKSKHGLARFLGTGHTRRREKKGSKKHRNQTGNMEWPLMPDMANQDVENQADLSRIHFYGDMMECDVLNTGLSWMVQSFFNRLWFLNRPPRTTNANASGDMSSNQQIVD